MNAEELVRKTIEDHLDKRGFDSGTLLVDELGADSLDLVQMVMEIEDDDKVIPLHLLDGVKTVGDLVKMVTPFLSQENEDGTEESNNSRHG